MQFLQKTNFDFVGKRYYAYAFSILLLGAGIVSLLMKGGPKLGVDFTGGTLIQLQFARKLPVSDLRTAIEAAGFPRVELQDIAEGEALIVRIPQTDIDAGKSGEQIRQAVLSKYPDSNPVLQRAEYVGPAVGRSLARQAQKAIFWTLVLIIIYVGIRFRSFLWGICSIAALGHDVLSVLGIFSILNKEVSITVVAGILTLAGYSMNDTIVIYDRMRENFRLSKKENLKDLINRSINETLSRTVMTSLTVVIALCVLFFFGGEVIHDFSFAMLYGVIVGSYSSIFVAAPMIYEWQSRHEGTNNRK